jgi:hypothetical protein
LSAAPHVARSDEESAPLIEHIRRSLMIQAEILRRILDSSPHPSILLAKLREDTGNRYLDYSELVSAASIDELPIEEQCIPLAVDRIVNG